ncbi:MAG: WbqC family protein [Bacteroidales bacterium]|nr:WbqC family protein [Bacteroidales bacterium]
MASETQTVLLSTAYLPPLAYFHYLLKAEKVVIEQFETYPKQTFRNRCEILSANGKHSLSIPVIKVNGNHTLVKDVAILNEEKWQLKHRRAIEAAYRASPFFMYYVDGLEIFFRERFESLLQFNLELTRALCLMIGFEADISLSASYRKDCATCTDLRAAISPKQPAALDGFPAYTQVFSDRHRFLPNLSIIDLLFNLGPETQGYLEGLG